MINVVDVNPAKDLVLVKLLAVDDIYENLITVENSDEETIAIRYGEVISVGPDVDLPEHCKDLKIGEVAVFTQFAGYYIPTNESHIYKVIRGYDVIGKALKVKDLTDAEKVIPTGNRLLVEEVDLANDDDGIIINKSDPALADLSYGKVLNISPVATKLNLKINQLVAYPPYVGTDIRAYTSEKERALKMIVEEDILFTIK